MTEFGSNLSTIYADGHVMLPTDPLDTDSAWVCEKTGASREAEDVKEEMARIGMELEVGGIKIFILIFIATFQILLTYVMYFLRFSPSNIFLTKYFKINFK